MAINEIFSKYHRERFPPPAFPDRRRLMLNCSSVLDVVFREESAGGWRKIINKINNKI
jgi:hypothetical protein